MILYTVTVEDGRVVVLPAVPMERLSNGMDAGEALALAERIREAALKVPQPPPDRNRCPACLAPVRVHSADEGTNSYDPQGSRQDGALERCTLCGAEPA